MPATAGVAGGLPRRPRPGWRLGWPARR